MVDDLKMIKKHYGEEMMHLCRELFPTILETPGLLYSLMEKNFAPTHYLYEDIVIWNQKNDFRNFIYGKLDVPLEELEVTKTPSELMDEAGYVLYECKSERDIQKFRKYYANGESLCTFSGGRLDNCYVFFAVKKNVDEIRRENFSKPERQDEYGTSVISIQFSRGDVNTLSIKNRYNHKVNNPDATFSNNLDNIISGLSASFQEYYGLNINQNDHSQFELYGYVLANDGRYYKYNHEIGNIYFCPDNIIIDNFEVIRDYQEKEKYIVANYFIIDLVNKNIIRYKYDGGYDFSDLYKDIKRIEVTRLKNGNRLITLVLNEGNDVLLEIDKLNQIIGYRDSNVVELKHHFLAENRSLKYLDLPNLVKVGDCFLSSNKMLSEINLPNLESCGVFFLDNSHVSEVDLPKLKTVGNQFLSNNYCVSKLLLPNLVYAGRDFVASSTNLISAELPKLKIVDDNFLCNAYNLISIKMPVLEKVGDLFLSSCISLLELDLPSVRQIGDKFMYSCSKLRKLNVPVLEKVGKGFLSSCISLLELDLPSVRQIGGNFMYNCKKLRKLNVPVLEKVGYNFLFYNADLAELIAPELSFCGSEFLYFNNSMNRLYLPKLGIDENGEYLCLRRLRDI